MRYCPRCFTELPQEANYCPKCRESLKKIEEMDVDTQYPGLCKRIIYGFKDKAIQL